MEIDITYFFNIVKFIFALIQGNYVTVTEISRFIEFFTGTHTNTVHRVNKMLCEAEYEAIATDLSELELNKKLYRDLGTVDMYYIPKTKGLKWSKVEETVTIKNNELIAIKYLQWNPQILFEIFDFTFEEDVREISKKIIKAVEKYNLIDSKREIVDRNILVRNIEYLKRILDSK